MNGFYTTLRGLLAQEKDLYAEAVGVSQAKKEAVSKGQVAELDGIVRAEQGLVIRLQTAERRRLDCLGDYAALTGRGTGDVTLAEMVESAPESERVSLAQLHEELRTLLESLLALNQENRLLVESRLQYTQYMLSVLTDNDSSNNYAAPGSEQQREPTPNLMDFTV